MDNKAVIIIQKKFLLKKFLAELKIYRNIFEEMNKYTYHQEVNIFDKEKQQDNNYNEMQKFLMKKDNKRTINKILFLLKY